MTVSKDTVSAPKKTASKKEAVLPKEAETGKRRGRPPKNSTTPQTKPPSKAKKKLKRRDYINIEVLNRGKNSVYLSCLETTVHAGKKAHFYGLTEIQFNLLQQSVNSLCNCGYKLEIKSKE